MIRRLLCWLGYHDGAYRWYVPHLNATKVKCRHCEKVFLV